MERCRTETWLAGCLAALVARGGAAQNEDELAKEVSNPISSLISVPLQLNYDTGLGPNDDGGRVQLNVQPVVPISISKDWNMISRTIVRGQWTVPLILQYSKVGKIGKQPVSFAGGFRYFADAPDDGPKWGVRFALTLLYPQH